MSKLPTKKQIKHKRIILGVAASVAVLLVIAFYMTITRSGHWLVSEDEFDHVDWVVVLDGQSPDMERSDYAAEMFANGKADSVLILGRRNFRNRSNVEFYLDDFMKLGDFDSNAVFVAQHDDASTVGEAYTIIPWLKKHNADTVMLLTAASSTKRVKHIFKTLTGEKPVYVTKDIHDIRFNPDSWFTSREACKEWLRAWMALLVSYYELLPAGNLTAQDSFYYKPIVNAREYEAQKNPVVDLQSLLPKVKETLDKDADTTAKDTVIKDTTKDAAIKDTSKVVVKDSSKTVAKDSTAKTAAPKNTAKKDTTKAKP